MPVLRTMFNEVYAPPVFRGQHFDNRCVRAVASNLNRWWK